MKFTKNENEKIQSFKGFSSYTFPKTVDNTKTNTLIIGNLEAKEFAQSNKQKRKRKCSQNRSSQNHDYLFRSIGFLAYKRRLVGKYLIEINGGHASKGRYVCGTRQEMTPWEHTINCDCRNIADRIRNSSQHHEMFPSQNAL